MIISPDIYERCCSSYRKVIDEFNNKFAEIRGSESMVTAILDFSKNYLLPSSCWENCYFILESNPELDNEIQLFSRIRVSSSNHFQYNQGYVNAPGASDYRKRCLLEFVEKDCIRRCCFPNKRDLVYPHSCLFNYFESMEECGNSPISKDVVEKYEEMKKLYLKIQKAERGSEQWFKLLCEANDHEFVIDNCEICLGEDFFNIQLWKLYINYLKENDVPKMLEVYSKYCRFFLDDEEMKENYKIEFKKSGRPIKLPWNNLFDFEKSCNRSENFINVEWQTTEMPPFNIAELTKRFYETEKYQNFSFKNSYINYILDNADHLVLRKLFKTCKYFFAEKLTPICYRFEDFRGAQYDVELLSIKHTGNDYSQISKLKNLYITTSIHILITSSSTFLSNIIPLLYRCTAKYIKIFDQDLSFNELKFLIEHGNVVQLFITNDNMEPQYKDMNGEQVNFEDIMKYLTKIVKLRLQNVKFSKNTSRALANEKFIGKIISFSLTNIFGDPCNLKELLKYFVNNRNEKIRIFLGFNQSFGEDFVQALKRIMKSGFEYNEFSVELSESD